LFVVIGYLELKYPHAYEVLNINNELYIRNKINGDLEVLALLTMDDFNILQKRADGEYYLTASATLFTVCGQLDERIGYSIRKFRAKMKKERLCIR
jgi:hypothetical protein